MAAALTAGPLLEASDVTRDFGGVMAVDGASFSVAEGRITGLIGPNGAGKSTMVNVISGTLKPRRGRITFGGAEIGQLPAHQRARRGLIRTFQLSSEFGRLTVLENLLVAVPRQRGESFWGALLGPRFWGAEEWRLVERARELLRRFDMYEKQDELAGTLSGGQKRLVEIMRGLMANPRLLLLDEPMAGVNPALGRRIENYLVELRREGVSMLMVEHDMNVVERLCDPVVVMARGKVLARGGLADLRSQREVLDAYLVG